MEDYDYVRFAVADIYGRSRGRSVSSRHAKGCIQTGITVSGATISLGINEELPSVPTFNFDSDRPPRRLSIIPDLQTLHSVPWCGSDKFKVAEVICESYWLKDNTPQLACPRFVARQQLHRLAHHGFKPLSGFEMEFLLADAEGVVATSKHYASHREQAKKADVLFDIESSMLKAEIDIENMHAEHDPGLFEMVLKPQDGIIAVDSAFTFKTGVQEMADKGNYNLLFTSNIESANIGMHFNHSLWSVATDRNVFAGNNDDLSKIGRHWLAGLVKHAIALTPLFSPTVNCYQRLHQSNRPNLVFWDLDDRAACFKVKSSNPKDGIYLENRMPSGMSNRYLVLAATVAAGLDGVQKKLECPPTGKESGADVLSQSLPEAIRALMADSDMVESLGRKFVEYFVATLTST